MTDPVIEAERILRSIRGPDFAYSWTRYTDSNEFPDWVAVSTFGAAHDLGPNDPPDQAPVRLRCATDESETEVYLTADEADNIARDLRKAARRARSFLQPPEAV